MFEKKVQCPRCGQVWTIPQYSPGVECNCHLWCDEGNKPSDCSLTLVTGETQLGWPAGMNLGEADEGSDVMHRRYYCSVHKRYSYREPVFLEVDNKEWQKRKKLPSRMRELPTQY